MTLLVGTDIGGTFTDLVGYDSERRVLLFGKTLTQDADLVEGVLQCMRDVGLEPAAIDVLKHGTTQIINTLLERRGARTALVTTRGFRDIIEIGRGARPIPFDLDYQRNPPLVPRAWRFELAERMDAKGNSLIAPDAAEITALAAILAAQNIEAVAVSFLHAYRNPAHEDQVAAALRQLLPGLHISAGSELSREWFEYERGSTAIANAYVGPRAGRYLDRLDQRLAELNFTGRLLIMGSNGGNLSVRRAREQPIALVESGPIGGCIGAAAYARTLGIPKLVAFDMGGTTAKCALIEEYGFEVQTTYHVGSYEYGFPVQTPVVDIIEVGTGGGSIAHLDAHGRLLVGPRSAGADPGPVCFGHGGTEPTITDANVALGRIGTGAFLGGALKLDRDAARHALMRHVGLRLGYGEQDADTVASGIVRLADVQMSAAIKEITIERGKDARDFTLFAFGGGGPLHATNLARELGIRHVVVPPEPGNFSALGMLLADARIDEMASFLLDLEPSAMPTLLAEAAALQARIDTALRHDFPDAACRFEHQVQIRYKGQRHALRVTLQPDQGVHDLRDRFIELYRQRYGLADPDAKLEMTGLRVSGFAAADRAQLEQLHRAGAGDIPTPPFRKTFFAEQQEWRATPVYPRMSLPIGARIAGPAIIEEFGATTVIGPADTLWVGALGELRIDIG